MNYDDDRYFEEEDDNELWNDELDIDSEDPGMLSDVYDRRSDRVDDSGWETDPDIDIPETEGDDHDYEVGDEDHEDYYSEPESEPAPKPSRGRFFGRKEYAGDDVDDFYDSDVETVQVKKAKAPKLDPEDPDYWIEEESGLSSLLPKPKRKWKWWLGGILTLLILIYGVWIWFFQPYVDGAVKYGYIKNMEHRGSIVKTFEGSMIPYKEIGDSDPMYFEEVRFSVESDSLAAKMKRMMLDCLPVRVEYEVYHAALPWKGDAKMIITKVDSVDVDKILPPEYRYYK